MLASAAKKGSPIFTIGCDLGRHRQKIRTARYPEVAGGFVHFAASNYRETSPERYQRYVEAIAKSMRSASRGHKLRFVPILEQCEFGIDEELTQSPTVRIWFKAFAQTKDMAARSREALVASFSEGLFNSAIVLQG